MRIDKIFTVITVLILLCAPLSAVIAGNIYVDGENGSDTTGDGSEGNPYKTIQKAVDAAVNDDEILADVEASGGAQIEYEGVVIDNKNVAIKRWKGRYTRVVIKGDDGTDGNPPTSGKPGVHAKNGAKVHLKYVEARGGRGGNGTGVQTDGAPGGPGILAENAGTTVTKERSTAYGGKGGDGSNGGGDGGKGGKGEQSDGAWIKNLYNSPAKGGEGGKGGENASGAGGDGGDGGAGARAINSGTIEYDSKSIPTGGYGGDGGNGTPPGSQGSDGARMETDGSSQIDPLAIQLTSFIATIHNGYVEVEWTTTSEINNAGFNVYRSSSELGQKTKLNNRLIPSKGHELEGAHYSFKDYEVTGSDVRYYWFEDVDLDGETRMNGPAVAGPKETPKAFDLAQNHPNPFNPVTEISYDLAADCYVKLEIYNVLGQRVATLVDEYQTVGSKTIHWNPDSRFSSGIYFYRLHAGTFVEMRKMVLLK